MAHRLPLQTAAAAAVVLVLSTARTAEAQFGGSVSGMSAAFTASPPVGSMADIATTGFGISLRSGSGSDDRWSGRGVFGFDYFPGQRGYHDIQFIVGGFDIVHRIPGNAFYQFGGLSLSNTRFTSYGRGSALTTQAEQDFGLTGGVGVNYGTTGAKWFLEFAATTYFTRGENSTWFPVRIGLRF